MTILPVKKKREKDAAKQQSSSQASSTHHHHQHHHHQFNSSNATSSGSKRNYRVADDGPLNKRWAIPQSAISPRSIQSNSNTASSVYSNPRVVHQQHHLNLNVVPTTSSNSAENLKSDQKASPPGGQQQADYNSDDEYREENQRDDGLEADFAARLARRGLVIKEMEGDGACMFRAIAEQIYGDQEMHGQIRRLCMDYMLNNKDHFREFITENYESYIDRKRADHVHGNHVELQAISEMFARPVEVYQYSDEPINVLLPRSEGAPEVGGASTSSAQQYPPLRLSYHRAVHYNAILAPNVPTIGVGLGLPGMIPGEADKNLMASAMKTSELEHIEETMLQDKIDLTDYQRTQADLEDQIARESLMTYLNDLESRREEDYNGGPSTSQQSTSGGSSGASCEAISGRPGLYEELLAAQSLEWDAYTDDVAIAEALLVSQQDYLSAQQNSSTSQNPGPSKKGGAE